MKRKPEYHERKLWRDLGLIVSSIFLAWFLSTNGALAYLRSLASPVPFLDSFVSGMFFTSLFTTPLSFVFFADIAKTTNILYMALWGACGAVVGDTFLFFFIKDTLEEDVKYILRAPKYKRLFSIFKRGVFRYLTPCLGALVIASPLPDELGIAMMGFSDMETAFLVPVSFIMNFIGILLIGILATTF